MVDETKDNVQNNNNDTSVENTGTEQTQAQAQAQTQAQAGKKDPLGYAGVTKKNAKVWDDVLRTSRKTKDDYTDEEWGKIQKARDAAGPGGNAIVDIDAVADTDVAKALHRLLMPDKLELDPNNTEKIEVDTIGMAGEVRNDNKLTADDRYKYQRALNILQNIQDKGFTVIRNKATGRYWIEKADGQSKYVANGILEISELLNNYMPTEPETPKVIPKEIPEDPEETPEDPEEIPVVPEVVIDPEEHPEVVEFSNQDLADIAALIVDIFGTAAGMGIKMASYTSVLGAGFGHVAGGVVSLASDVISTALNAWSDFTSDNVTAEEAWENLGIRVGFGVLEATTFAPASLAAKLGKASKYGRILRSMIQYGAMAGQLDHLQSVEWTKLLDKNVSEYTVEDWQNMGSLAMTVAGLTGTIAARRFGRKAIASDNLEYTKTKTKGKVELEADIKKTRGEGEITKKNKVISEENKKLIEGAEGRKKQGKKILEEEAVKKKTDAETEIQKKADADKEKIDASKYANPKQVGEVYKKNLDDIKKTRAASENIRKRATDAVESNAKNRKGEIDTDIDEWKQRTIRSRKQKIIDKNWKITQAEAGKIEADVSRMADRRKAVLKGHANKEALSDLDELKLAAEQDKVQYKKDVQKLRSKTKKRVKRARNFGTDEGKAKLKERVDKRTAKKVKKTQAEIDAETKTKGKLIEKKVDKRVARDLKKVDKTGQKIEKVKNASKKTNAYENKVAEKKRKAEYRRRKEGNEHYKIGEESTGASIVNAVKRGAKKIAGIGESKVRKRKRIALEVDKVNKQVSKTKVDVTKRNAVHSARLKTVSADIKNLKGKYPGGKNMPTSVKRRFNRLRIEKENLQHQIKQNQYELDAVTQRAKKKVSELQGGDSSKSRVENMKNRQKEIANEISSLKKNKAKGNKKKIKALTKENAEIKKQIKKETSLVAKTKRGAKGIVNAGKSAVKAVGNRTFGTFHRAARKNLNTYNKGVVYRALADSKPIRELVGKTDEDKAKKAKIKMQKAGVDVDNNASAEDILLVYKYMVENGELTEEQRSNDDLDANKAKLVKKTKKYIIKHKKAEKKKRLGGTFGYAKPKLVPKAFNGAILEGDEGFFSKAHMTTILKYIDEGNLEKAKQYLADYGNEISAADVETIEASIASYTETPEGSNNSGDPNEQRKTNIRDELKELLDAGKYDEAAQLVNASDDPELNKDNVLKEIDRMRTEGGSFNYEVLNNAPAPGINTKGNTEQLPKTSTKKIESELNPIEYGKYKPSPFAAMTYIKPSDLLALIKGRAHKDFSYSMYEHPTANQTVPLVRNMHGFASDMNATKLLPRVDGNFYDTMTANTRNFATGLKARNQKSAENAKYVDQREAMAAQAMDNNALRAKQAKGEFLTRKENANKERMLSEEKTWREDRDWTDKLHGRVLNDTFRTAEYMYNKKVAHDAGKYVDLKSIWDTNYKDRIQKLRMSGKDSDANALENEFQKTHGVNPYEIDKKIREARGKIAQSNNPYDHE
jgi:hypothetical protein